jgi:hypothetical protein
VSASESIWRALGRWPDSDEILIYFSARLDETDTHDKSLLTVVGGAVAMTHKWDLLEADWKELLDKAKVETFHYKDFLARAGDFSGWGDLKAASFIKRVNKIIDKNVAFRVAVGVDSNTHAAVKERMRGIKGFRGDSDFGLCLRWLLVHSCEVLTEATKEDFSLSVIVEDGPYAAGAVDLFHRLRLMRGPVNPAKHAHRYGDIAVLGKKSRSLQAADAIAGVEADRLGAPSVQKNRLSVRLTADQLEKWYELMLAEKQRRREYSAAKKRSASERTNS